MYISHTSYVHLIYHVCTSHTLEAPLVLLFIHDRIRARARARARAQAHAQASKATRGAIVASTHELALALALALALVQLGPLSFHSYTEGQEVF